MKKRLLALALCLVLAVSLLPVTAAAANIPKEWINGIVNGGTYCGDTFFTLEIPEDFTNDGFIAYPKTISISGNTVPTMKENNNGFTLTAGSGDLSLLLYIGDPEPWTLSVYIRADHEWSDWTSNGDGTHSRSCTYRDTCGGYETEDCVDADRDHKCDVCKASVHTWRFTQTDSTLTATCTPNCTVAPVSVTLKAHSVTLPDDPFHATVEVSENIKEAFPNAQITGPKYRYKDSEKGWIDAVPGSFTPKAGQYQAQAYIDNLFGNEVAELRAFSTDDGTNQIGNHVDLWVDYTAADPKVTAQTGDNRPIEIMMISVLVFSALAAAAFALDSKRRYRQ